jgi:hypothetical protein
MDDFRGRTSAEVGPPEYCKLLRAGSWSISIVLMLFRLSRVCQGAAFRKVQSRQLSVGGLAPIPCQVDPQTVLTNEQERVILPQKTQASRTGKFRVYLILVVLNLHVHYIIQLHCFS